MSAMHRSFYHQAGSRPTIWDGQLLFLGQRQPLSMVSHLTSSVSCAIMQCSTVPRCKHISSHHLYFFTVLRQPTEQIWSAFDFFKPGCGESWEERIEWLNKLSSEKGQSANLLQQREMITQAQQREINMQASFLNSQAHDLGWYEFVGNTAAHDKDDETIHSWIDELDDSFGLVMLTEYFNEGLLLLRRKLGVEVKDMAHIYMKRGISRKSPPKDQSEAMRHLNHVDTLLYNHFNRTFWREWDRAGGYSALGGELRQLHKESEELEDACSKKDSSGCAWSVRTDTAEYTDFLRKKKLQLLGLTDVIG